MNSTAHPFASSAPIASLTTQTEHLEPSFIQRLFKTSGDPTRRHAVCLAPFLLLLAFPALSEISAIDQHNLEENLGKNVVGPAIPAKELQNPVEYLHPIEGIRTFLQLTDKTKTIEQNRFLPWKNKEGRAWKYRIADQETRLYEAQSDGSVVLDGINDFKENVSIRYTPAKPAIMNGLGINQEKRSTIEVRAYKLNDSEKLLHYGTLDVVSSYIGAYEINVPAGRYQTILIRTTNHGRIGPAKLDNIQYHFYAQNVGEIASVDIREVNAFGIYHSKVIETRVLNDKL